jgi:hypothetical protein
MTPAGDGIESMPEHGCPDRYVTWSVEGSQNVEPVAEQPSFY